MPNRATAHIANNSRHESLYCPWLSRTNSRASAPLCLVDSVEPFGPSQAKLHRPYVNPIPRCGLDTNWRLTSLLITSMTAASAFDVNFIRRLPQWSPSKCECHPCGSMRPRISQHQKVQVSAGPEERYCGDLILKEGARLHFQCENAYG